MLNRREMIGCAGAFWLARSIPIQAEPGGAMEAAINTSYRPAGNGLITGKGIGDFEVGTPSVMATSPTSGTLRAWPT